MEEPASPEVQIEFVYTPLPPESIRWYYYKASWSAKGVAQNPEIPHRGSLLRFCDSDNVALEAAFRSRADELERCWWEEEAELAALASGKAPAPAPAPMLPEASMAWQDFMTADERTSGEAVGVLVRSGAHEVDLCRRLSRPCYFPANSHRVLRGAWFAEKGGEWVPLKESLADQLEEGYRQALWLPSKGRLAQQQPGGFYAARLDLNSNVDRNLYALYASESEMFLCQETSFAWLRRLGSTSVGETRLRLRRGYEVPPSKAVLEKEADLKAEEADDFCAATPVTRLVLVVHGIGQQLSAANIAQDAVNFRAVMRQVGSEQVPGEGGAGRTEVLPVQWRKHLTLEIDQLSAVLMPPGVRALRQVLFATVVEVLLYLTPLHRADILCSLVTALNSTYSKFMLRNPHFKGSVSILAHSLGSVLCHDILCNQPPWAYPAASIPHSPSAPSLPAAMDVCPTSPRGGSSNGGLGAANKEVAALQQEVARLRAENQRLALQLDVARADTARLSHSPTAAAAGGGSLWLAGGPQQQQAPSRSPSQQLEGGGTGAGGWAGGPGGPESAQECRVTPAGSAVVVSPLKFQVDQLIYIGSPLSVFLALRGVNFSRGRGLGTAASAPLNQTSPDHPCAPDGLPAAQRMYNLYHPYDPVGHRLEPLGVAEGDLQRPAYAPYARATGGKRVHISVQESLEDMGTTASRIGTSLLSSLAFAKFKGSVKARGEGLEAGEDVAGGSSSTSLVLAAEGSQQVLVLAGEASGELPLGNATLSEAFGSATQLAFGQPSVGDLAAAAAASEAVGAPSPRRTTRTSASGPDPTASPSQTGGAGAANGAAGAQQEGQEAPAPPPPSALPRLTDGGPDPGSRTAKGRLDFVLQESTLENQYLSALSSHFSYWSSPDVALFVLRAVHGLDVLTGAPKHGQQAAQQQQQATAEAVGPLAAAVARQAAEGTGPFAGPTSPRVHLASLPG